MTRTARRKQLALILCCSFAGTLAAVHAGDAVAQAPAPLRVDPVLLGLPPVKKEEAKEERASVPAKPEAPKTQVEVVPVEPAAVEVKTVVAEPEPESPRDERGAAAPAVEEKAPAAQSGPAVSSPAKVPPQRPSASVVASPAEKPAVPVIAEKPGAAPASPDARVSALEPLRVDPALLGLPPIAPVAQAGVSGAGVTAVRRAAAGSAAGASGESAPGQFQSDVVDVVDDGQPALALRAARKMETPPKNETAPRPAFLSAQRMSGEVNREFNAEGEAELRKIGTVVNADRLTYWPLDDEMEAEGSVRLQQGEDVVTGPKMRLRIEDQVGYFEKPAYQLKRQLMGGKTADDRANSSQRLDELSQQSWWDSGFSSSQTRVGDKLDLAPVTETRGEADRLEFEGENHYRLLNNTFTTCPIDNNDWYVRTSEMRLDYDREVGEGDDATVYFKDVPFLYSPWISFSLSGERKSGLPAATTVSSTSSRTTGTSRRTWMRPSRRG